MSVYHKESPDNIKLSLNSIIDQTVIPSEIVLVKDGPLTEELDSVIENFQIAYSSIFKIIELPKNIGLGAALKEGLSYCSCEYVARMDSDDISAPNRFEKQLLFLKENIDIDIVGTAMEEFNEAVGDLKRYKIGTQLHRDMVKNIKLRSPINHATIVFRKQRFVDGGGYMDGTLLFEDYAMFLRLWKFGLKFHNLQEILYYMRVGDGLEVIARRSGIWYLRKEILFLKYAREIGVFSLFDQLKYAVLKFPIRLLPKRIVLAIYNKFLRSQSHP